RQIETLTGLDFGPLRNVDVGSVESFALEAAGGLRELNEFADIRLPGSAGGTPGVFDGRTTPFGANGAAEVPGTELSYYLLAYDENGRERVDASGVRLSDQVVAAAADAAITDIVLFSHGWNWDIPAAREQYTAWIAMMAGQQADRERMRQARPKFRPL